MKQTPLYEEHRLLKARMVDYAGWQMPVQYAGIVAEHEAVRRQAGLFDVSHMGELLVSGSDAEPFLQQVLTRDVSRIQASRAAYALLCNEQGGVVDDILVYRLSPQSFFLVVNAANTDKVADWLLRCREQLPWKPVIDNQSDDYAQIALQGPAAAKILQPLVNWPLEELKSYGFHQDDNFQGHPALISRTGYTGEDGFELYLPPQTARDVWQSLLERGGSFGLQAAGLGARDSLRLEAGMPLYGHELAADISPVEAGLEFFVHFDKPSFIGKDALLRQQDEPRRRLYGLEMTEKIAPRQGYDVYLEDQKTGQVTSGGYAPFLQKSIGLFLAAPSSGMIESGTALEVEIRHRRYLAHVASLPFYRRPRPAQH